MKEALLIVLFPLMPYFRLEAQTNLVPNYSFEDTLRCINNPDNFSGYVADWNGQGGGGGLCYFTAQCPGDYAGGAWVPKNNTGFQYARTGVSYAGTYNYISDTATTRGNPLGDSCFECNYRNYIQTHLISPLSNGIKYFVTFYVSLANSSEFACNDIGAYLSDSALNFNNYYVGYQGGRNLVKDYLVPQIANNPITNPLTDTLNWMKVTGSYIAHGGEKYIIIGNFLSDTSSHIVYLPWNYKANTAAYYYIDDVFVTTDSLLAGEHEPAAKAKAGEVKVYPNPNNGKFALTLPSLTDNGGGVAEVYNMLGQRVYRTNIEQGILNIDISGQPNGVYLYRLTDSNGNLIKADRIAIIH